MNEIEKLAQDFHEQASIDHYSEVRWLGLLRDITTELKRVDPSGHWFIEWQRLSANESHWVGRLGYRRGWVLAAWMEMITGQPLLHLQVRVVRGDQVYQCSAGIDNMVLAQADTTVIGSTLVRLLDEVDRAIGHG